MNERTAATPPDMAELWMPFTANGQVKSASRAGAPGARAYDVFVRCYEKGVLTRYTGDMLAFSPPLIIEEAQIDEIFRTVVEVLKETDSGLGKTVFFDVKTACKIGGRRLAAPASWVTSVLSWKIRTR